MGLQVSQKNGIAGIPKNGIAGISKNGIAGIPKKWDCRYLKKLYYEKKDKNGDKTNEVAGTSFFNKFII